MVATRTAAALAAAAALVGGIAGSGGVAQATAQAPVAPPYSCGVQGNGTVAGTFGDAGLIGWAGDKDGVVACLGGSFYVRDGVNTTYGYGIYDDSTTTWTRSGGWLPALTTAFGRSGAQVVITNFGDRVVLGGNPFVIVYSRVEIHNPTSKPVTLDPQATPGLIPLHSVSDTVAPGATVDHDYAVVADRFGGTYALPTAAQVAAAGSYDAHFSHMQQFWTGQQAQIAQLASLPDPALANAYRAGFVDTQIIRDGNRLTTGENGYDQEYSHDVIGILANLFTQGDYSNAHSLLLEARHVVGTQTQYADGLWTYAWPWALYLEKTGDLAFVKANFSTEGAGGSSAPSIEDTAHQIAADRTGPGGIMEETNDIDANGYWTIDNYEALMGLLSYRYLAQAVGKTSEAAWATNEYNSLLAATNATLSSTISKYGLGYLPCSMTEPNTDNRCTNPEDANWASPFLFGRWAWDGSLFGAAISGPGASLIDATYRYGFDRLAGKLPADTFGGYSPDFWSTAYNAGYGSWGLASSHYRDQGIVSFEWMIANDQSGPFSWWESSSTPNPGSPWAGVHPSSGNGAAPHAWGIANADKVLLDALAAQRSDGSVLLGRGVPDAWLKSGVPVAVTNFPTVDGHRMAFTITGSGRRVTVTLDGAPGPVLIQLPAMEGNIASASAGAIQESSGTVTVPAATAKVVITLDRAPS